MDIVVWDGGLTGGTPFYFKLHDGKVTFKVVADRETDWHWQTVLAEAPLAVK